MQPRATAFADGSDSDDDNDEGEELRTPASRTSRGSGSIASSPSSLRARADNKPVLPMQRPDAAADPLPDDIAAPAIEGLRERSKEHAKKKKVLHQVRARCCCSHFHRPSSPPCALPSLCCEQGRGQGQRALDDLDVDINIVNRMCEYCGTAHLGAGIGRDGRTARVGRTVDHAVCTYI